MSHLLFESEDENARTGAHPEQWRAFSFSEFFANDITWWNVRTVNSTHKFSVHYWCTGETEVFDLLTDPLQLHNLAGVESSALGMAAAAEMLPLGVALSSCANSSCYRPALPAAALPPLAPNATHLPCYPVTKAPLHPEWPAGSCSKGASKRLVVESPWSQFTSECQRF
eukprot:SAG25_NODE_27_length_21065_cov_19.427931_17_plen_169_part_00